jgi:hypothetical protein
MAEEKSREAKIAEHLGRYGVTTENALRRMIFPELTEKAVKRLAERLVESGWLAKKPLPGGGRYFRHGERAAKELGLKARQIAKGGYQALVQRLGVLYFCAKLGVEVIPPAKFRGRFPELCKPGFSPSNYYLEKGEVNQLGFIHVDHGRTAERLASKMRTRITNRYRDEDFARLIEAGRFLIAIAAPTEEKARAVIEELERRGPSPVRFRVEHVPELFPLLLEPQPKKRRQKDA